MKFVTLNACVHLDKLINKKARYFFVYLLIFIYISAVIKEKKKSSYIDDGKKKRIYESFTADTRKESEFAAAKFALDKKAATKANMTVEKAINTYIDTHTHTVHIFGSCLDT